MDDLSGSEYPSMLAHLQPNQAVQALGDRVKRITRINQEIADWLQERRKVEEQYYNGLRRLLMFKVPNAGSELGAFQGPWDKILRSTDSIAASHHLYARGIEKDVEQPLRGFAGRKEMQTMQTISANLSAMAAELDDAQSRLDKLGKKGGKASASKVDEAAARLETAAAQWDSQAPFIFESLQALDEQRINHLRDVLTQYETHEVDQAQRTQQAAEEALSNMLEISTEQETASWAQRVIAGKPKIERRSGPGSSSSITRQSSTVASYAGAPPSVLPLPQAPPMLPRGDTAASNADHASRDETVSNHSGQNEPPTENSLRSRIGTMLGRRRQSIHGGFGQLSPAKASGGPFGRGHSSHGRSVSPRVSSNNLGEGQQRRLPSLAERPTSNEKPSHEGPNGLAGDATAADAARAAPGTINGNAAAIFDVPPPDGPPPPQQHQQQQSEKAVEAPKDADGFTVPPAMDDPISQAQREAVAAAAGDDGEQFFKLNIKNEPVAEEDADAKKAAMSNVANALGQMSTPTRRIGTIRGRRDVRNTIYIPSPTVLEGSPAAQFPPSPLPMSASKPWAVAALASEANLNLAGAASDAQSVRSANSLGSLAHLKHPDMQGPGLNSSIIETVSATLEDGVIKTAKITGEIAFSYNAPPSNTDSPALPEHEKIRINNFSSLEVIGPNRIFVHPTAPDTPDAFTLDVSHLAKTAVGFTYRVHEAAPAALAEHCPLVLEAAWKPQGDKLGLLLQYCLNPLARRLPQPVTLHNLVIVAMYEGARASGAQTKPSGTHLRDKQLVYWRLGDVTLSGGDEWHKILCRITGAENGEPLPGHVEARWEYGPAPGIGAGISVSRAEKVDLKGKAKASDEASEADDPFADSAPSTPAETAAEEKWTDVPLERRMVSGRYEAK